MLGGLAGFGEKRKQAAGITGRFDLGEANVAGNNCENVVKVVRYAAGECA